MKQKATPMIGEIADNDVERTLSFELNHNADNLDGVDNENILPVLMITDDIII